MKKEGFKYLILPFINKLISESTLFCSRVSLFIHRKKGTDTANIANHTKEKVKKLHTEHLLLTLFVILT